MSQLTRGQRALLRQLQSRHGRRKAAHFVCEGERCCREALARQSAWVEFGVAAASYPVAAPRPAACVVVPDAEFAGYAQTENPQGILLVLRRPPAAPVAAAGGPCVLALDRVADPGNVGTILRTAWAVGLHTVTWVRGGCDPFSPKAVRAGMGAQFALELPTLESLAELTRHWPARRLWLSAADAERSCFDAGFSLADSVLVLGNEGGGVGPLAGAGRVRIPMPGGAESLNVAQAATVLLFEALRRGQL